MKANTLGMVQGNILLYAAFVKTAPATVTDAKATILLPLNVFKYPPGKEPCKTATDNNGGSTTLPEKEENPVSLKVSSSSCCFQPVCYSEWMLSAAVEYRQLVTVMLDSDHQARVSSILIAT
jgi:hypothetical protein